jgi:hypothetical protein
MPRVLSLVLAIALAPTAAAALTVQDVVALSKAGVAESVMLAMIDRDKTIFALDAAEVIALQRDGVSERVVMALLKSGREETPSPGGVPSTSGTVVAVEPLVVGVGHGPERPNTFHDFDALGGLVYPVSPLWFFPPSIPFVYSLPLSGTARQRTPPACATGARPVSGSRAPVVSVNCHRTR